MRSEFNLCIYLATPLLHRQQLLLTEKVYLVLLINFFNNCLNNWRELFCYWSKIIGCLCIWHLHIVYEIINQDHWLLIKVQMKCLGFNSISFFYYWLQWLYWLNYGSRLQYLLTFQLTKNCQACNIRTASLMCNFNEMMSFVTFA